VSVLVQINYKTSLDIQGVTQKAPTNHIVLFHRCEPGAQV